MVWIRQRQRGSAQRVLRGRVRTGSKCCRSPVVFLCRGKRQWSRVLRSVSADYPTKFMSCRAKSLLEFFVWAIPCCSNWLLPDAGLLRSSRKPCFEKHYGFHACGANLPSFNLIAPFAARPRQSHRNTNPKRNIPCVALQNS